MKKQTVGLIAKRSGTFFENQLMASLASQGFYVIRIEDGCKPIGRGAQKVIRLAQPFDFLAITPSGTPIFLDAKVRSNAERIQPSMLTGSLKKNKRGRMVMDSTMRQFTVLNTLAKKNLNAGFVVYLSQVNKVYWVPAINPSHESAIEWGSVSSIVPHFK